MQKDPIIFDVPAPFAVEGIVGQGAYGAVCKASWNGDPCAIKKIPNYCRSPESAKKVLREIEILQHFQFCPQIVCCHLLFRPNSGEKDMYAVMEYVPADLSSTIKNSAILLDEPRVRYITCQLLLGLHALHSKGCIHRDLSTRNILINSESQVFLCDFGLSRHFDPDEKLSFGVVTQWYRAPEILLDAAYDYRSDVWSVGVVLGELLLRSHLFPGRPNEAADQLNHIFRLCGTPNMSIFQQGQSMENASVNAKKYATMYIERRPSASRLSQLLPKNNVSAEGIDLFTKLLSFDPFQRPTAKEALQHPFFDAVRDFVNDELAAQEAAKVPMLGDAGSKLDDVEALAHQIEELVKPFTEAMNAYNAQLAPSASGTAEDAGAEAE